MSKQHYTQSREIEIKKNRVKQSFLRFLVYTRITKLKWQILSWLLLEFCWRSWVYFFTKYIFIHWELAQLVKELRVLCEFGTKTMFFWWCYILRIFFNFVWQYTFIYFLHITKITKRFTYLLNLVYMISTTISWFFVCLSIPGSENFIHFFPTQILWF